MSTKSRLLNIFHMLYTYINSYRQILFTIIIVLVFHQNILELLDKYIIPIVSKIPDNSPFIAVCFLSFSLLFIITYNNYLQRDKFVLSYILLTELCVTSIYLILKFRFHYVFFGCFIDYVLIFLIPLLIVESIRIKNLIKECLHKRNDEQQNHVAFELDIPCADDNLVKERSVYAEHLIRYIFGTFNSYDNSQRSNPFTDNGSFVINVCEEYGYGKTSFFALLYNKLTTQWSNQYIAFCYRPWMCENENSMVNEFFNIFREELSSYNPQISKNITNYIRTLLDKTNNILVHFVRTTFCQSPSMQEERQKLKEAIVRIGKPIIVFIDDVDRLQKEELLILLKLVRDTADFQNVFYIMAADKNHISSCLKDCNISNPDNYLKKIINYELMLPGNDKLVTTILENELKSQLSKYVKGENSQNQEERLNTIVDSIINHEEIESVFRNIRDIKRLLNDYMLTLTVIKSGVEEEIDYKDLFLLTLIKMLRPDVYIALRENEDQLLCLYNNVYIFKTEFAYNVHNERIQETIKEASKISANNNDVKEEEEKQCKTIDEMLDKTQKSNDEFVAESLRYLFNEHRAPNDEIRIKYKESYYRYFSGQLRKNQLSSLEVKEILSNDDDHFQEKIKDIHKTNKTDSFITRMLEWSEKWEKESFYFVKKIYLFSKEDIPLAYSNRNSGFNKIDFEDKIYYTSKLRYSQILFNLYNITNNNVIDDEKRLLHNFIMENNHYDFSARTINILLGQYPNKLIIKREELISWRKELIRLFIKNSIKNNPNPFKDEILDVIPIIKGGFIDSPWDNEFADYLSTTDYFIWFEKLVIYENAKFTQNNKYMKQLDFFTAGNIESLIEKCSKSIQEDERIKDIMSLIYNKDFDNIENHPFLLFIKSKYESS